MFEINQESFEPVRIGVVIVEVLKLHTQATPRHRVALLAAHINQSASPHLIVHSAGIRAIVGAGTVKNF